MELRHALGLGIRPVPDIVTLLELELGVRVFIRKLDSHISGLFVYDETLGPCVLLNANHPRERRVADGRPRNGAISFHRGAARRFFTAMKRRTAGRSATPMRLAEHS